MPSNAPITSEPQPLEEESYRFEALAESLSLAAMADLRRYAKYKMWGIKATVCDSDADDLVHEAIQRTLDGRRLRNKELHDLLTHLKQCVSSIANEWFARAHRTEALIHDIRRPARQHEELEAQLKVELLRSAISKDLIAWGVLESMLEGYSPAEAQETLNIPSKVYNAARRRICRLGARIISLELGAKNV